MHGRPSVAASFSLRPQDSLWDGAHDARLTGDVVDEIPGGKVDRADWSGVPDDLGDGVCPRHKLSLPYPSFPLVDCDRCSRTTRPGSNPAKLAATVARAWSLHAARGGSCAGRRQQLHACSALLQQQQLERSSQARFGGLTLVSRAPWLLVTGAPGLFSWPNTLWTTAVACRMSPTSRTRQAAASRRHRHRNSRGAAAARRWPPTQAWMLHDWLTVDLNEMLPAADLNIIIFETE